MIAILSLLNGKESDMTALSFPGGFTVLMAVYERDDPSLFRMAIQSVFDNTVQPDSILLVVDGPITEELELEIELALKNPKLRLLHLPQNVGLAQALNMGIEQIETEWLARADADDFNLPNRFEIMALALNATNNRIDVFGGAIQEVDPDGTLLGIRQTPREHEAICKFASKRNPFNHMTIMARTRLVRQAGGYPNIPLKEDYALWAQLLKEGAQTANLADILVLATTGRAMYRRRGGLSYALSEIQLQKHLVRCGLKSSFEAIRDGFSRALIFLMPSSARAFVYIWLLRR